MRHIYTSILFIAVVFLAASCTKDDLEFPLVKAEITDILVQGQCGPTGEGEPVSVIDKDRRRVEIYLDDQVDIRSIYLKRLEVSNNATVTLPDYGLTFDPKENMKPILDFSDSIRFVLNTYQKYEWTVVARQIITREIELEGQVGQAVIDTENRVVIAYISPSEDLSAVKVNKMVLAGIHGSITPDPTGKILDFRTRHTFEVKYAFADTSETWSVYVYHAEQEMSTTASVFPHSVRAYVSGTMQNNASPVVEYRQEGEDSWTELAASKVKTTVTGFTAEIEGLTPGTKYQCQVTAAGSTSEIQSFTTAAPQQVENGGFDDWHCVGEGTKALYNPWLEGQSGYWDTGNKGATTVGASNSRGVSEGGRTYADLQSKYIVIKFAAGNVFTGTYLKTDGTNGILSFGRPFSSFPTKLQFDYRYITAPMNKGGGKWDEAYSRYMTKETYESLRGRNDTCQVFVALIGDKDEEDYGGTTYPFIVRTRPSELKLFTPNSDNVIAYGQFTSGNNQQDWKTIDIPIKYRFTDRMPKYIIIVACSSKFGDYFIGSDEARLHIDNMKLMYE